MKQTGDHIKIMRNCYKNPQMIKMHFTMAVKAIIVRMIMRIIMNI